MLPHASVAQPGRLAPRAAGQQGWDAAGTAARLGLAQGGAAAAAGSGLARSELPWVLTMLPVASPDMHAMLAGALSVSAARVRGFPSFPWFPCFV